MFKVVHTGDSTLRSYLGTLGPTFSKGAPIQGGQHRGQYFKGQYFKKLSWYSWANIQQSYHGTIGPTFSKVIMVLLGQHSAKLSWYYWANIQQRSTCSKWSTQETAPTRVIKQDCDWCFVCVLVRIMMSTWSVWSTQEMLSTEVIRPDHD